jgi:replicative DNA helicase
MEMSGERELPYDIEMEQALIGSLLIEERLFWRICDRLTADEFYDPLHQRIFTTIARVANTGGAATPLTVGTMLKEDAGLLELASINKTGDSKSYLISLARSAPMIPNVVDYARILRSFAQRRRVIEICQAAVRECFAGGLDPVKLADDAAEFLYEATHGNEPGEGPISVLELSHRAVALAEKAHNRPQDVVLSSGLSTVDEALGGIFRTELLVIGAATSMGKTSLVQGIGLKNAKLGHGVLIDSLEMQGESVALRYLAEAARIPSIDIRRGRTSGAQIDKLSMTTSNFADVENLLKIDGTRKMSVAQIRARAMAFKRRCPAFSLLIIDHLQFIESSNPHANENESSRQITHDLCSLAQELNIAIILISHLTKENERRNNKRPIMNDLYGSGGIAQNADAVWFVYRPEYYLEREEPDGSDAKAYAEWDRARQDEKGWAEIFSTKARMGKTGSCRVRFEGEYTRFYDPPTPTAVQNAFPNLAHEFGVKK